MSLKTQFTIVLLGFAYNLLSCSVAFACSPVDCNSRYLIPRNASTIPANTPAIFISPGIDVYTPFEQSTLKVVEKGTNNQPKYRFDSSFSTATLHFESLKPNTTYEVLTNNLPLCGDNQPLVFKTKQKVNIPSTRTQLELFVDSTDHELLSVSTSDGSCSKQVKGAQIDLQTQLPSRFDDWKSLLVWETYVDGKIHYANSNNGRVRLSTICESLDKHTSDFGQLKEGVHEVMMKATLVGTQYTWNSNTVSINMSCDDGWFSDHGEVGGCSTTHHSPQDYYLWLAGLLSTFVFIRLKRGSRLA